MLFSITITPTFAVKKAKENKSFSSFILVGTNKYMDDDKEVVEYYYKDSSSSEGIDSYSIRSIVPDEGDFRITIVKETLQSGEFFDSEEGLKSDLMSTVVYYGAQFGTSFISKPIYSFLTSSVISLVNDGHKAKGDAYTRTRTVHKYGDIYTNGNWASYYHGTQEETYWFQDLIVYSTDSGNYGTILASDHVSYLPLEYDPIIVDAENLFRDNNAVYLYSLDRY